MGRLAQSGNCGSRVAPRVDAQSEEETVWRASDQACPSPWPIMSILCKVTPTLRPGQKNRTWRCAATDLAV